MLKTIKNNLIWIVFVPFIWINTGMFWFEKGVSYTPAIILIFTLIYSVVFRKDLKDNLIDKKQDLFLKLLIIYLIICVIVYFLNGYSSRQIKAIGYSFLYLLFLPKKDLKKLPFKLTIVLSATGFFVISFYQYFILNTPRVHGYINPIVFGSVVALVCCISLLLMFASKEKTEKFVFFICFSLLLASTVYHLSRGVWLALIFVFCFLFFLNIKNNYLNHKKAMLFLLVIILGVIAVNKDIIWDRAVTNTSFEFSQIKKGDFKNSVGLRLQMFKSGFIIIEDNLLFGVGDNFSEKIKNQYNNKQVNGALIEYPLSHFHNQYIDKFVKTGILGFLSLLSLILYPMIRALKYKKPSDYMLISICSILFIAGLTDVPLNHGPILYYFFIMAYFLMNVDKKYQGG